MKTLKKSLVLVLSLMMVIGVVGVFAGASYTDDDQLDADLKEATAVLSGLGIVEGNGDGTVTPTAAITRAEFAKILYEAVTGREYTAANLYVGLGTFTDVPTDEWYAGVVNYAAYKGWILGYGDGTFGPNDNVLGVDAITMILRAIGYGAFGELSDGDTYAMNAITEADSNDMLDNTADADFNAVASRQLCFEWLYKAMQADPYVKVPIFDEYDRSEDPIIENVHHMTTAPTTALYVVTAVPESDRSLINDADEDNIVYSYRAKTFDGTNVGNAASATYVYDKLDTSFIGAVVEVYTATVDGTANTILYVSKVSDEVTIAEKIANADIADTDYVEAAGMITVTDGTVSVAGAGDDIEAGTYASYYNKDTKKTVLVTYFAETVEYTITELEVKTPEGKDTTYTLNSKAVTADNTVGLDAFTKDGTYLVATHQYGNGKTEVENIGTSVTGTITATSNDKDGLASITIGGTTYPVAATGDELNGKTVTIGTAVTVPADAIADKTELIAYIYEGSVVALVEADEAYGPGAAPVADPVIDIDGFAKVLGSNATITVEKSGSTWVSDGTITKTVTNAQVQVLLSSGEVAVYDLPVYYENVGEDDEKAYILSGDGFNPVTLYDESNKTEVEDHEVDITSAFADTVYAYTLDGDTITLYNLATTYDDDDVWFVSENVTFSLEAYTTAIGKNATSIKIDSKDYALTSNVGFVGTIEVDGEDTYTAFSGVTNMPGSEITPEFVILRTVVDEDNPKNNVTTVEFIFGGEIKAAQAANADSYVYIDVTNYTYDGTNYVYDGYLADGTVVKLSAGNKALTSASGLYTYKSDLTVDNDGYQSSPANSEKLKKVEFDSTGDYVLAADGYKYVADADVAEVAGAFEEGCKAIIIVDADNTNNVVAVWVIEEAPEA